MSLNIIHRFTTVATLTCGIAFLVVGSTETLLATSFTWIDYDSTISSIPKTEEQLEVLYSAATSVPSEATAGTNILIGAALIFVGLLFHAFVTLRKKPVESGKTNGIIQILFMDIRRR